MSVDTSSATATAGVDPSRVRIAGAIKQAASTTGTSFEYLLATAKMESDFNPTAGASTSSAHGLYQFIDQTWLGTVKEAGAQLGYGQYADAITKSSSGGYSVSDPAARNAIMKLRDDPAAASSMAAVLTQSNSFKLTGMIGRRPTDGELYMAHFMGVGGAAKLINERRGQSAGVGGAAVSQRRRGQPLDLLRSLRAGAQRVRSLFGADRALRRRRQFPGHPHRDGVGRRRHHPAQRRGRKRGTSRARDRQRRLSVDVSGCPRGGAGHDGFRIDSGQRRAIERSDLPLAVSGARRTRAADLADGSGIVGQFLVADLGCER